MSAPAASLRFSSYTAALLVLLAPLLLAAPQSSSSPSGVNIAMTNAQNFSQQAASNSANSNSVALYDANGQPLMTENASASNAASSSNQGSSFNSLSIQSAPGSAGPSSPGYAPSSPSYGPASPGYGPAAQSFGPTGVLSSSSPRRKRCVRHHGPRHGPGSFGGVGPMSAGGPSYPSGLAPSNGSNTPLSQYYSQSSSARQASQNQASSSQVSMNTYNTQGGYGNAGAQEYDQSGDYSGNSGYRHAGTYATGNVGAQGYGQSHDYSGNAGYRHAGTYADGNYYGGHHGYHGHGKGELERIGDRAGRFSDKVLNFLGGSDDEDYADGNYYGGHDGYRGHGKGELERIGDRAGRFSDKVLNFLGGSDNEDYDNGQEDGFHSGAGSSNN